MIYSINMNVNQDYYLCLGKMWVGNDSSEVRGRVPVEGRSRTPSTRVRSASAGRDQKQEMAAR